MGWETRRNGRSYYYRKERTPDGRVRSEYVGRGYLADLFAASDRVLREQAAEARARLAEALAPVDRALALLLDGERHLRLWRDASLAACGYRRHRGQWRRRRGSPLPPWTHPTARLARLPDMATRPKTPDVRPGTQLQARTGPLLTLPDLPEATAERLREAITAAEAGDDWQAVATLRDVLAELPAEAFHPFAPTFALRAVAGLVVRSDVNADAPDSGAVSLSLAEAEIHRTANAFAEAGDGPLTLAAVRHAALTSAVLDAVTDRYAAKLRGAYAFVEGEHWERRLTSAQTRHFRALATVAKLREVERAEIRRADRHVKSHGEPYVLAARRALAERKRPADGRTIGRPLS